MKILNEKQYNELVVKSKENLVSRMKVDKINNLIEQYEDGKNIFTVMRDIKEVIRNYK